MKANRPIVLIEDDEDDQATILDVILDLGVTRPLLFFDDCDKANQYLLGTSDKPFLILCDINLPKVNGLELKRRIESNEALRKKAVPFVFLTTSDNQSVVNMAYQ